VTTSKWTEESKLPILLHISTTSFVFVVLHRRCKSMVQFATVKTSYVCLRKKHNRNYIITAEELLKGFHTAHMF